MSREALIEALKEQAEMYFRQTRHRDETHRFYEGLFWYNYSVEEVTR
jgi:hypothetical protein|tara:strand:- start:466 stop:606 length:141 start_codon:yes stop_codon:yes gene_type:complete